MFLNRFFIVSIIFSPKKLLCMNRRGVYTSDTHQVTTAALRSEQMCNYDLDDLDIRWLNIVNGERALMGKSKLTVNCFIFEHWQQWLLEIQFKFFLHFIQNNLSDFLINILNQSESELCKIKKKKIKIFFEIVLLLYPNLMHFLSTFKYFYDYLNFFCRVCILIEWLLWVLKTIKHVKICPSGCPNL